MNDKAKFQKTFLILFGITLALFGTAALKLTVKQTISMHGASMAILIIAGLAIAIVGFLTTSNKKNNEYKHPTKP